MILELHVHDVGIIICDELQRGYNSAVKNMVLLVMQVFWLFLPAGVANMAPVLFRWIPIVDVPVDFGFSLHGERIFGQHKTYRGFVAGILSATAIVYFQKIVYPSASPFALLDYSQVNIWLLGFILGGGALFGDLIKSFFKRRFHIADGKSWVPFDQIDWIVGAMLASSFVVTLDYKAVFMAIAIFGILHPIVNVAGYYTGFRAGKGSPVAPVSRKQQERTKT